MNLRPSEKALEELVKNTSPALNEMTADYLWRHR